MKLTPRPYQQDAINLGVSKNMLFGHDCGLGKTLMGVETILQSKIPGPHLIICPNAVKNQWVEAIEAQSENYLPIVAGVAGRIDGSYDYLNDLFSSVILIIHFEAVRFVEELRTVNWGVILIDEAHRIKNRAAKQTHAVKKLKAERRIALTATPIESKPKDMWSIFHWLDSNKFSSYWSFYERFTRYERHPITGYKTETGVKNIPQLLELVAPRYVRKTKEQVAPDLPPKTETWIKIPLDPLTQKLYETIANSDDIEVLIAGLNDPLIITHGLALMTRLRQVVSFPGSIRPELTSPTAKTDWIMNFASDVPERMVIFTEFRATVLYLEKILEKEFGEGSVNISISGRKESASFKAGHGRFLVGTTQTLGTGINLDEADYSIFIDQPWSSIQMHQAIERIHRLNSTRPKWIYYLTCPNTIDDHVKKTLENKWSIRDAVLNWIEEQQK